MKFISVANEILFSYQKQINDLVDILSRYVRNQADFNLFVRYLASNERIWPELVGYFTRQAIFYLLKQEDPIITEHLNEMEKIIVEWEPEETTEQTPTVTSSEPSTVTSEETTTLGSSSVTSKMSLIAFIAFVVILMR